MKKRLVLALTATAAAASVVTAIHPQHAQASRSSYCDGPMPERHYVMVFRSGFCEGIVGWSNTQTKLDHAVMCLGVDVRRSFNPNFSTDPTSMRVCPIN